MFSERPFHAGPFLCVSKVSDESVTVWRDLSFPGSRLMTKATQECYQGLQ